MLQHLAIAGATGLVGSALLDRLLTEPSVVSVQAPTRRNLAPHPLLYNPVGSFSATLDRLQTPIETAFCCLGTTMAQAKSREAFSAVDLDLVVAFAEQVRLLGARHFILVSAMGANPDSRLFYNRVKGQVEQRLREQNWPQLTIARPSLLIGARTKPRFLEGLSAPLAKWLPGNYAAIQGTTLAHALWRLALEPATGVRIVKSAELRALGRD